MEKINDITGSIDSNTKKWQNEEALKRYRMISPLLDESLDAAKKLQLRERIADDNNVSVRTIYRYEQAWLQNQFEGLKPVNRGKRQSAKLPANFEELLQEAILLKREVPLRSVHQIIRILELEGRTGFGVLKRSTLQRHLYDAGFGKKQIKRYAASRDTSSRRFCKPHRMMLAEADIKYGPYLPIGKNGTLKRTYMSVIIDDHSRYVLDAHFYDNQTADIIEDSFRRAILSYGKFQSCYVDNGRQYISRHLGRTLAELGIQRIRAKPRTPWAKGCVESFNRTVSRFNDEARAHKIKTLEELNHFWEIWLNEYYHNEPHEGLREYYISQGMKIPEGGVTPYQEWMRDSKPLVFIDVNVVAKAFMHYEKRRVDSGACIKVNGMTYEVTAALIGANVTVAYDPAAPETVTVIYPGIKPITAKPLQINEFCNPKPSIPASILPTEPEYSRLLKALENQAAKTRQIRADALSFCDYLKENK